MMYVKNGFLVGFIVGLNTFFSYYCKRKVNKTISLRVIKGESGIYW